MKNVGNMPKNLSILLMTDNKLAKLSKEIINFVPKLKDFNVENNQFNNFPAALAKIVNKGPTISFKGTDCDNLSHRHLTSRRSMEYKLFILKRK